MNEKENMVGNEQNSGSFHADFPDETSAPPPDASSEVFSGGYRYGSYKVGESSFTPRYSGANGEYSVPRADLHHWSSGGGSSYRHTAYTNTSGHYVPSGAVPPPKKRGRSRLTSALIILLAVAFVGASVGYCVSNLSITVENKGDGPRISVQFKDSAPPATEPTAYSELPGSDTQATSPTTPAEPENEPEAAPDANYQELNISSTPTETEPQPADGRQLTIKQVARRVKSSVVGISAESVSTFGASATGSGIIMSDNGYIITNNHVIEGADQLTVILDDGTSYDGRLVGADQRSDIAVLKIEAESLYAAEFGDSDKLEVGDTAIAIGNPMGLELQGTVTSGIISATNREIMVDDRVMVLIQTDASINPGNSGGPLANAYGQVIGINTIKYMSYASEYTEGLGFSIPINEAKPIVDELILRGYIRGRPALGIDGITLSRRNANYYGYPPGVYVKYVDRRSSVYASGLREGDVITGIADTAITSMQELTRVKEDYSAGDTVSMMIFRRGEYYSLTFQLMDEHDLYN